MLVVNEVWFEAEVADILAVKNIIDALENCV